MLSKSIANALSFYGDSDTKETECFVGIFDRFFDMINSRCLEEEIYKRKPDLALYKSLDDPRFKVLQITNYGAVDILYTHACMCVHLSSGLNMIYSIT